MVSKTFLGGLALLGLLFAGCRSKPALELYEPGKGEVWRKVDRTATTDSQTPKVLVETNYGNITLELFPDSAPISVENFLQYVEEGHYEGTIFHRVISGFMIQGGGLLPDMSIRETRPTIVNEAGNGLRNVRGTVAMARTNQMDTAAAQFFINIVDNPFLNGDGVKDGYAVFGRVYDGMQVADAIALVETTTVNGMENVPVKPVIIQSVKVLK